MAGGGGGGSESESDKGAAMEGHLHTAAAERLGGFLPFSRQNFLYFSQFLFRSSSRNADSESEGEGAGRASSMPARREGRLGVGLRYRKREREALAAISFLLIYATFCNFPPLPLFNLPFLEKSGENPLLRSHIFIFY